MGLNLFSLISVDGNRVPIQTGEKSGAGRVSFVICVSFNAEARPFLRLLVVHCSAAGF